MAPLKIVADEDIFLVEDYFSPLGKLITHPGRRITADLVRDADALLVRSVTPVNRELVASSSLKFIASASSGMDHMDALALQERGIQFSHAPGSNASAVADYVFSAMASLSQARGVDWRSLSVGVIGAGNVGGKLVRRLAALGIVHRIYDPYLEAGSEPAPRLSSLEQALGQDLITLHVPLTTRGRFPTWNMLDAERIEALAPGAILINTARGAVVDNEALLRRLRDRNDLRVVLDAWDNEPALCPELLKAVDLATPHIAGHSLEGKLTATQAICKSFCSCFDLPYQPPWTKADEKRELPLPEGASDLEILNACLLFAYNIDEDCRKLRAAAARGDTGAAFDGLRKAHRQGRREFSHFLAPGGPASAELGQALLALGFSAADPS